MLEDKDGEIIIIIIIIIITIITFVTCDLVDTQ